MTKVTTAQRDEAISEIKGWLRPGDTVYLRLGKVAPSGMSRWITPMILRVQLDKLTDKPHVGAYHGGDGPECVVLGEDSLSRIYLGRLFGALMGLRCEDQAVHISGCGMDMGMRLVTSMAYTVFGDERAIKYVWL